MEKAVRGYLRREFIIDGEKYIYDFSLMPVNQALAAETLFKLQQRLFMIMPGTPDELDIALQRNIKSKALGALLMKTDKNGKIEIFDPGAHAGFEALSKLKGGDYFRLEECRSDFFQIMAIASEESIMQSDIITRIIKSMDANSLKAIAKSVNP